MGVQIRLPAIDSCREPTGLGSTNGAKILSAAITTAITKGAYGCVNFGAGVGMVRVETFEDVQHGDRTHRLHRLHCRLVI